MMVLVTGATGYIGGRLIPKLLKQGHQVRVLVRDERRAQVKAWADRVEIFEGDLLDASTLAGLCDGVDAGFYLVHSMASSSGEFESRDRQAVQNFISVAGGLKHVVYLGGLMPKGDPSKHLRSRAEVGEILREHLPATEFRAGPIIGSGSASFEMVRYLTERLPAMVAPRWIGNRVSTISIRDVLSYLVGALQTGPSGVVEIGSEALTFKSMMHEYARVRGLRRWILPVPVLAPKLAARWVGLVTPIPNKLAVPIVAGMTKELVADTAKARELFPEIDPADYETSVRRALKRTENFEVETRWSDALGDGVNSEFEDREGIYREHRSMVVDATPEQAWAAFASLGGETGWLFWNFLWRVRGLMDRVIGGPGLRRGRRHPTELVTGDSIDFWRVERAETPKLLRLRAEMKLPGKAWMQWETQEDKEGTRIIMSAMFAPRGLMGVLYWKSLALIHRFMFSGLIRAVARRTAGATAASPAGSGQGEAARSAETASTADVASSRVEVGADAPAQG